MRSFSPLDLVRAGPWTSAFFTTFSLSLAYFEAVILDALTRQDVRQNLILADVVGVRAALSEYGARHAGRSYQIEPVAVERGCFHSKLMALTSLEDAHLVIGSGNVTVGGWGSNLECTEHLHPSFAADAFDDTADFLEALATTNIARHAASEPCARLATDLRRLSGAAARRGNIRAVASLDRPVFDQLAEFADDLGGARRLAIASPFFDDGPAIDRLCTSLGLDRVSIHAHGTGVVASAMGNSWPAPLANIKVAAVTIEPLANDTRHLHAKVFEVLCRRGRILMSGSTNATMAALMQGRNVELSVVRIQREPVVGWHLTPSSPLEPSSVPADDDAADDQAGILRAELRSDELNGEILTPFPAGGATVWQLTGAGPREIAATTISAEGRFSVVARGIEMEGWEAKRLIIRVQSLQGNHTAEGFVFFPDVAEITRRAGAIAGRLLAILAGTEMPADVAAVMTWFYEHPEHLRLRFGGGGGAGEASTDRPDTEAYVSDLLNPPPQMNTAIHIPADASTGWRRFMDQVFASFRVPRGPIVTASEGGDTVEDDGETPPDEPPPQIEEAMAAFDHLFDLLLGAEGARRDLGLALQISQYICDRLLPPEPVVESYLNRLLAALSSNDVPVDDRMQLAAAILVWAARRQVMGNGSAALRGARRRLLRLGVVIAGEMPEIAAARSFTHILTPGFDFAALWNDIRSVRTFQEEVRLYRHAGPGPLRATDFPALATLPEWAELAAATPAARARIHFLPHYADTCPRHYYCLPVGEMRRLQDVGVARAANCCNAILMCEEV